jgi:predicted MPP superfamily phosphohydrolase
VRLVLLVLLAVVLVYGAAFVRLALRLRRGAPAPRPLARAVDRALFGAATLGTALLAYGLWGEPRRLEVTTVALPLAELAPGSTPIRLVQISDLHSPSNVALHETLATRVRALRPHAIVFTGDAVNTPAGAVEARALFTRLGAIAPTYAVRGNRDAVLKGAPLFEGTGAIELDGATAGLADGRNRLVVVGATWVYVNRGIGMEALLPKVRILARPEVTLLELRPAGPPG